MRVVLDSGGLSALAGDRPAARALRAALLEVGLWPPVVPAVVLTECLTGDHRRDHAANRLLGICEVDDVGEDLAREAAALRFRTGRADRIGAVDAVVAAAAVASGKGSVVVTSDPDDLDSLLTTTNGAARTRPV